jgi:putative tryptophan/tyrosine transport system substrate-binding protein
MKRREFFRLIGGIVTLPVTAALAQQAPLPVIGFLHSASPEPNTKRLAAFHRGLQQGGFFVGQNVAIEYRWAGGENARLPELAKELVQKPVTVIATLSSTPATLAAKAATSIIPIFFLIAEDPVELGLVTSLNRPGGNITGISSQNAELFAKRLGLLHELSPQAQAIAVLLNYQNPNAQPARTALQQAAAALGVKLNVLEASTDTEIEAAYASLQPGSPLLIGTDPSLFARRTMLVALGAKHSIPTMYDNRESANLGGLMSYGQNTESSWEQAGISVASILKGAKAGDLPVMRPTKFEFVVNLKTAKALGLELSLALQARADELIE